MSSYIMNSVYDPKFTDEYSQNGYIHQNSHSHHQQMHHQHGGLHQQQQQAAVLQQQQQHVLQQHHQAHDYYGTQQTQQHLGYPPYGQGLYNNRLDSMTGGYGPYGAYGQTNSAPTAQASCGISPTMQMSTMSSSSSSIQTRSPVSSPQPSNPNTTNNNNSTNSNNNNFLPQAPVVNNEDSSSTLIVPQPDLTPGHNEGLSSDCSDDETQSGQMPGCVSMDEENPHCWSWQQFPTWNGAQTSTNGLYSTPNTRT
ncbi:unnamed protein product [Lepeophtheirus salmonis]|uniref:(salmon louse) hypothetical protein n=1 Tax=Lepeophtheirus salmonis TaxID=72036 RepID=A0A7R8H9W8_LEPSM|nr:unnamed protein product [Lepeophtheirus salmonis]CAF2967569.1 unnamed protein product [Lepeophtheirus salmonis]